MRLFETQTLPSPRPGATPLSRFSARQPRSAPGRGRRGALARASLVSGFVLIASTACLDAPPDFNASPRVPPVVLTAQVDPPLTSVHRVPADTDVAFTIPFRSDDLDEKLTASFFLDLDPKETDLQKLQSLVGYVELDPWKKPFDQQEDRPPIEFTWTPGTGVTQSCHSVTMILTHQPARAGFFPEDELDAARETWWFEIVSPTGDGMALVSDCPPASAESVTP